MTAEEFAEHIRERHTGALARSADEILRSADLLALAWHVHHITHLENIGHEHDPPVEEPKLLRSYHESTEAANVAADRETVDAARQLTASEQASILGARDADG